MSVDTSISIGNMITIASMIGLWLITLAIAWTKFGGRMDMLEFRIKLMEEALIKVTLVLEKFNSNERDVLLLKSEVASLQADYTTLNQTVEGLRRGQGYIQMRRIIDGEYAPNGNG